MNLVTLTDAHGRVRTLTLEQFRSERGPSPWAVDVVPPRVGRQRQTARRKAAASSRGEWQCACGRRFTWKPGYHRHKSLCLA